MKRVYVTPKMETIHVATFQVIASSTTTFTKSDTAVTDEYEIY